MNIPNTLLYTKSHEWVQFVNDTTAKIGLTDFAQESMGDLVFFNLPEVDDEVSVENSMGDVESVKAVSDIYSPFTGVVTAVNELLMDEPETINSDPYGAWIAEISNITEKEELLDAAAYELHCKEEQ